MDENILYIKKLNNDKVKLKDELIDILLGRSEEKFNSKTLQRFTDKLKEIETKKDFLLSDDYNMIMEVLKNG